MGGRPRTDGGQRLLQRLADGGQRVLDVLRWLLLEHATYGTARSAAARWENRVTYGSLHALMTFDALGAAPLLAATPLLLVHGRTDGYCAPELAEALYADAAGPKELRWLDATQHIELYDVEPYVTQAADAAAEFLHRRLND